MLNNKFTLYFSNAELVHLGKDVFLAPYFIGKQLGCSVRIVYPMTATNSELPAYHKGVRLIPISWKAKPIRNRYFRHIMILLYIIWYMVPSKYGMLFHYYRMDTVYYGLLYKTLNPFGKLYLKLDASLIALKYKDDYQCFLTKIKANILHWWFSKVVNCVSCETSVAMEAIKSSKASCYKFRDKMVFMPNGFDEDELSTMDMRVNSSKEKEDIFITVGRIGTREKNNEMMLDALKSVDLKDWKFYFIGGIEPSFKKKIDELLICRPDLNDKVIFTGNISSKDELWKYYNRAKVFVLTSRCEGCPLVFMEAARFGNYLISTNVGSFADLVKHRDNGYELVQEDSCSLAKVLEDIIEGRLSVSNVRFNFDKFNWNNVVKPVVERLMK